MAGKDNDWTALVLGGVATVLGWQTTRITEDIRSTRSVAYWTEQSVDAKGARRELVVIENVSKDKLLANIKFEIMCKNQQECIRRDSPQIKIFPPTTNQVGLEQVPSNLDEKGEVIPEYAELKVTSLPLQATIASGGKVGVEYELLRGAASPDFFFVPDPAAPLDVFVFEGNTVRGFVVRRYFEIMFASFVVTVLTLLAALAVMLGKRGKASPAGARRGPSRFLHRKRRQLPDSKR